MKKNVAGQKIGAQMCSATDGSAFTGSVTVYVTGDAGTQSAGSVGSGACTHEGNGYHTYAPAQAETNYDLIAFTFIGTGAIPTSLQVYTTFPQTGDAYAETTSGTYGLSVIENFVDGIESTLGTPSGASVSADLAAVKADTAATLLDTGTDGVVVAAASKTGYSLSAGGVQAIWDALTSALTTAGSVGKKLADWVLGADSKAVLSSDAHTGAVVPTVTTVTNSVGITAAAVDAIWDEATSGHTTAGTTGKALTDAASAGDPWATALPGAYGAGTAGKIIGDNINATVSSRSTQTSVDTLAGYVDTEVAAIKAKTDNLPAAPAATGDIPTAAAVADAVWDETLSGHLTAGSTGEALNAAGAAGDPWTTALPGAYGAGSAGNIIGNRIDAAISTRLSTAGYTAPDNSSIATILADTNDIQTRIPAALVAGRIDASVGAMAANVVTASAVATDAVAEIQAGLSTLDAAGVRTAVGLATANLDTQLSTIDGVADSILVETLTHPTLAEVEASTVLAKASATTDIKSVVDAVLGDTAELQVAHTNGNLGANVDKINGVTITGNGSTTPFDVV